MAKKQETVTRSMVISRNRHEVLKRFSIAMYQSRDSYPGFANKTLTIFVDSLDEIFLLAEACKPWLEDLTATLHISHLLTKEMDIDASGGGNFLDYE